MVFLREVDKGSLLSVGDLFEDGLDPFDRDSIRLDLIHGLSVLLVENDAAKRLALEVILEVVVELA